MLDSILIRLECLIQVCSCGIVYRIVLFNIDIIYCQYHRFWGQVHRVRLGDECRSPSSSEIIHTDRPYFIAFGRQRHTHYNFLLFCSATSGALSCTWKYTQSSWEAHRVAFGLFRSFWELLTRSVWQCGMVGWLINYFRTICYFPDEDDSLGRRVSRRSTTFDLLHFPFVYCSCLKRTW